MCLYSLGAASEKYFSLTGEAPGVKFTICYNSHVSLIAFKMVIPLAFRLNYHSYFVGNILRDWVARLSEEV